MEKKNKLIAKFMELPTEIMGAKEVVYGMNHDDWYTADNLNYHLSWDWLRPVMVKVDTYANSDSLSIAEYEEYRNKYPLIAEASIYDDISETHKQVVQFIKSIQLPF
jgi:hypothetical protein